MARFVITEERYEMKIMREDHQHKLNLARQLAERQIISEHFGKRADQKANYFAESPRQYYHDQRRPSATIGHKGPYLHATVVAQQQEGCYQQNVATKGPYLQTSTFIACNGPYLQPVTIVHHQQAPRTKKQGDTIDCNEAAKIYGGLVITDYGRNTKFHVPA